MLAVISGGQTGADQAGWKAAKRFGLIGTIGGWMPHGFKTELGPKPEFATLYNAQEHSSPLYPPRTYANANLADVTLWFGSGDSAGMKCTEKACLAVKKPFVIVYRGDKIKTLDLLRSVGCVNIAGNRESSKPGIGQAVEDFLSEIFEYLQGEEDGIAKIRYD